MKVNIHGKKQDLQEYDMNVLNFAKYRTIISGHPAKCT